MISMNEQIDDDFDPSALVSNDFVVVTFDEMWTELGFKDDDELKGNGPLKARKRGHIVREFTDEMR